jgi:hypothetical protein
MFDNYNLLSPSVFSHYCFKNVFPKFKICLLRNVGFENYSLRPDGGWKGSSRLVSFSLPSHPNRDFPLHRVFKTPGLRTPAAREQIYNISVNGSPLADSKEISLTVPVGGGAVKCCPGKPGHIVLLTVKHFSSLGCYPTFLQSTLMVWVLISMHP